MYYTKVLDHLLNGNSLFLRRNSKERLRIIGSPRNTMT